ncbi:MAG: hypothetical protein ACR2JU_14370 [Nocardioidaceae bacterium]
MDISTQLLHGDLEVDCPSCTYPVWVRYSEIVTQLSVLCPCCRTTIRLLDDRGTVVTAGDVVEQSIENALKDFFG